MTVTHYLVTGTSEAELERLTGLRGRMTHFGVLVEVPPPVPDWSDLRRAFEPPSRCICGKSAVIHRSNCPEAQYGIT